MATENSGDRLDTGGQGLLSLLELAGEQLAEFVDGLEGKDAVGPDLTATERRALAAPPPEDPVTPREALARAMGAVRVGLESAGPVGFAYIPGSGLVEAAVGELVARTVNRYVALSEFAPGLVALEDGLLRWMASLFGMPAGSNGVMTTGGSHAILNMLVAVRERMLGEDENLEDARLYVSDQAHHCVMKAARVAGFPRRAVRVLRATDGRRLESGTVEAAIREDRAAGLRPFLLLATAGTTNSGSIDPLGPLADLAHSHHLWFHVDACYGGFFILTARGRDRLAGIEAADSISLDPHKSLFMPFGSGALLMREPALLAAPFDDDAGDYLQDVERGDLPDYARLGFELTRESRGLRVWLPLQIHGTAAFTACLDAKLDLAAHAHRELSQVSQLEMLEEPELSIVTFRMRAGDDASRETLRRVNATGRVFCSSTMLDGRVTIRACVLSARTRRRHVDTLIEVVADAASR